MSQSNPSDRHALECLRLEAECRELAKNVRSVNLQNHYLRMATDWLAMAETGLASRPDERIGKCGTQAS